MANIIDNLRKEIHELHLALPWGACAAQIEAMALWKDEAYKEIIGILNRIESERKEEEDELDSEIYKWLKEHGTEETQQIIAMTARHFYYLGPQVEDTVAFQKGVAEGRRLEREDAKEK